MKSRSLQKTSTLECIKAFFWHKNERKWNKMRAY